MGLSSRKKDLAPVAHLGASRLANLRGGNSNPCYVRRFAAKLGETPRSIKPGSALEFVVDGTSSIGSSEHSGHRGPGR